MTRSGPTALQQVLRSILKPYMLRREFDCECSTFVKMLKILESSIFFSSLRIKQSGILRDV